MHSAANEATFAAQITLEASVVGVLAAVAGAAIAILVIAVYSPTKGWTPTMSLSTIALALPIGLVTGAMAGLVPAVRAARTPPAVTLRN